MYFTSLPDKTSIILKYAQKQYFNTSCKASSKVRTRASLASSNTTNIPSTSNTKSTYAHLPWLSSQRRNASRDANETLNPPSLADLASILQPVLDENYSQASVRVVQCPYLRLPPFCLAAEGLTGDEVTADVGGQPNFFPHPRLERRYDLLIIASSMGMSPAKGSLIGAGAGPFNVIGQYAELAPNLSWQNGFDKIDDYTPVIKMSKETHAPSVERCSNTDCALMVNLLGSSGLPGPLLKVTAKGRKGSQKSFSECIRDALFREYGEARAVSLGGVFVVTSGKSRCLVMPDFPSQDFGSRQDVENWLMFHNFDGPMICLSVLPSADPCAWGLQMEHTHCYSATGENTGGHYHGDAESSGEGQEMAHDAYFNTAKVVYRSEKPE